MYILSQIHDQYLKTKVLSKREEIQQGMMGRTFSNRFAAVLFVMPTEESSFWMKNCIIPLDVIFIQNGIVTKIYHNCPPCQERKVEKREKKEGKETEKEKEKGKEKEKEKEEDKACKLYHGKGNLVLEVEGGTSKRLKLKKGDPISFFHTK